MFQILSIKVANLEDLHNYIVKDCLKQYEKIKRFLYVFGNLWNNTSEAYILTQGNHFLQVKTLILKFLIF